MPGRFIVHPYGEIDLANLAEIRTAWLRAIEGRRPDYLVIDLRHVTFLSSGGAQLIVEAARRQRDHGGQTVVVNPGRLTGRVLQLTGVEAVAGLRIEWAPPSGDHAIRVDQ